MTLTERILPTSGLVCVSIQKNNNFQNNFYDTPQKAESMALAMADKGHTVYIAQATFSNKRRTQTNAAHLKNYFLDIDCGEGKPFATQDDGALALRNFCNENEIPPPVVVNSGNGLYAHWIFKESVTSAQWNAGAAALKELTKMCNFFVDQARTSDSASVLRPVGATHRKDPNNPKIVTITQEAPDYDFFELTNNINAQLKKRGGMIRAALAPPKPVSDLNAAFYEEQVPTANAERVATNCAQMGYIKNKLGDVSEPLWYASIQLLRHCIRGTDYAHEWSCGHPEYSEEATDSKLQRLIDANVGPTTCAKFGELNSGACVGCKHKNKIKSPIILGVELTDVIEVDEETDEVGPPAGYTRTDNGLFFSEDGEKNERFYEYDLRPVRCVRDMNNRCEITTIRHRMPHSKTEEEFQMKTSTILDPRAFFSLLADNHILVAGNKSKATMGSYMEGFIKKIQNARPITKAYSQMGWFEEDDGQLGFTLGNTVYRKNEPEVNIKMSANSDIIDHIKPVGKLDVWAEATKVFDDKSTLAHAFGFSAAAFGAPLMKFTGFPGALVAMVGKSGTGKTLMESWAQSVYGNPERLMMLKDDTKNALVGRLGVYGSLPLTIDEVTNMHPLELSELVYRVTQGRDKARLNRSAVERSTSNTWNTIAVVSSNYSIVEKLSAFKGDASAEINRVMEFIVPPSPAFARKEATDIYRMFMTNYGNAGPVYVKYLVDHQSEHQENIRILTDKIAKAANIRSDERYWVAIIAATLYGISIAQKLGLIKFNIKPLADWAVNQISENHDTKEDALTDPIGELGIFLTKYAANMVAVSTYTKDGVVGYNTISHPRGELVWRKELWTGKAYISRAVIQQWCADTHRGYRNLRDELLEKGVLIDANNRKNLGAFTDYNSTRQPCWEINITDGCLEEFLTVAKIGELNHALS